MWKIMTNNQKAFYRDGKLSEALRGIDCDKIDMITAVRIDKNEKQCCGTCFMFDRFDDMCRELLQPTDYDNHCQLWEGAK
jgi:hypothetical protein